MCHLLRIKKALFLLIFLFGLESRSWGASLEENTLSLDDAFKTAYVSNPDMKQAKEEIEASIGRKITESSFKGPEVRFEIGGFKSQEVNGEKVNPEKQLSSYEITQGFDAPGTLILKSQIAGDEVNITKGLLQATWAGVYKNVKSTYAEVLFQEEALHVFETNLNSARQFRDSTEGQYQSGKALKSQSIRSKIEVLKFKFRRISNGFFESLSSARRLP